jgi:hypothetical protein
LGFAAPFLPASVPASCGDLEPPKNFLIKQVQRLHINLKNSTKKWKKIKDKK